MQPSLVRWKIGKREQLVPLTRPNSSTRTQRLSTRMQWLSTLALLPLLNLLLLLSLPYLLLPSQSSRQQHLSLILSLVPRLSRRVLHQCMSRKTSAPSSVLMCPLPLLFVSLSSSFPLQVMTLSSAPSWSYTGKPYKNIFMPAAAPTPSEEQDIRRPPSSNASAPGMQLTPSQSAQMPPHHQLPPNMQPPPHMMNAPQGMPPQGYQMYYPPAPFRYNGVSRHDFEQLPS